MLKVEKPTIVARLGLAQALIEGGNTQKQSFSLQEQKIQMQKSPCRPYCTGSTRTSTRGTTKRFPFLKISKLNGPAWDASLEEMRASAYVALNDNENAIKTLQL